MADPDLIVEVPARADEVEWLADVLWQSGATAVETRDGSRRSVLAASFPTPAAAALVAEELRPAGARLIETDPSWRDAWRAYATPVEVGDRLLVAPAWRQVPLGGSRLVLRIDPGACFGSGTHPSTRLALAALDRRPPGPEETVVDVGCGSGILSVAAARLGAARVTALDIEPDAVSATMANAAANGVADRITASTTDIADLAGRFDVALANVTAGVHAEIGPAIISRVRPGGRIVVSGLLPGQWRHVESAYLGVASPAGPAVTARSQLEGWESFELQVPLRNRKARQPPNRGAGSAGSR